jgi:DNA-binding LacI/PurR family transcriptional regulator
LRASIVTIAEKCQVSRQTVSRALTDTGSIAPETRTRILEAAQEMGYVPSRVGRSMRSGRSGNIALLVDSKEGRLWLPDGLIGHIDDELALHDLHLIIARVPREEADDEKAIPRLLRELYCDGLLVGSSELNLPYMAQITTRHNIPMIRINDRQEHDCVYSDDVKTGYEATRHLLQQGHREIAYVRYHWGVPKPHYSVVDRRQGYLQAMTEFRCKPQFIGSEETLWAGEMVNFSISWLKRADRPTAVVAYSSLEAAIITQAATEIGCSIPNDLSLVTFSFGNITEQVTEQSYFWLAPDLGRIATQMLLQKMNDPAAILPGRALPAHFQPGRTTAPPQN